MQDQSQPLLCGRVFAASSLQSPRIGLIRGLGVLDIDTGDGDRGNMKNPGRRSVMLCSCANSLCQWRKTITDEMFSKHEMIFPLNMGDLEVSIAGMVESGRKAGNFAECFEHILRHFRLGERSAVV